MEEFNLSQTHFYRYLQMRSYLNLIPYYKNGSKLDILDNIIMNAAKIIFTISCLRMIRLYLILKIVVKKTSPG